MRAVLAQTSAPTDWRPEVAETSAQRADSVAELSSAIDRHQQWLATRQDRVSIRRQRRAHQLAELVRRRVHRLIADNADD